ncbi:MAG TPA: nucleotide disphospho-sugar-binding domain-containing protein [Gemmataceae bacterium]|nr:nucleotide disphospho-sugar-binding domain-containing protein [Gemmataceae bacterium]
MKCLLVPIGSAGDVHPFVGLGLALRRRGHDVTVVTSGYFETLIRRVGLDFHSVSPADEFRVALDNPDVWHPRRSLKVMIEWMATLVPRVYEAVVGLYEPGRTVVAAGPIALGARVAQEKVGLPMATLHLAPAMFRSTIRPPILPGLFMPAWLPRWVKAMMFRLGDRLVIDRHLGGPLNGFRAGLGLPPVRGFFDRWWHSPLRILGLFPEWFGPPQPDWPPQTRLTGFPLYDERGAAELPEELTRFLDGGEPPVVFTPGSAMTQGRDFFAAAVEACRVLGRRGLLLTRFPEQVPAPLPEGVRHFAYAPFSEVLPRAAALVHHGGIGTSAQALAAGAPQLVMPMAHDQPDNAARLRRLGVAVSLPRARFRGPTVAQALDELLGSKGVAENCRAVAARLKDSRAVEQTCDEIEALG